MNTARRLGSSEMSSSCEVETRLLRWSGSCEAISSESIDLDLDRSLGRVRWVRDEMRARAVEMRSISGDNLVAGADASCLLEERRVSCGPAAAARLRSVSTQ